MSFLKDHITKLKGNFSEKKTWVKRGDVEKQKQEEIQRKLEETEKKRKLKEIEKLRELSYNEHKAEHVFKRDEEGTESQKPISMIEKETKEIFDKQTKSLENMHKRKRVEENTLEEQKEEEEKKFSEEEMVKIRSSLRKMRQPIKLFGETDFQTYKRLCRIEQDDTNGITEGERQNDAKRKELSKNLTVFQQSLKDKLESKPAIDLEIGAEKPEDVIEQRQNKSGTYLDYKKFERECKDIPRKDKCTLILKFLK